MKKGDHFGWIWHLAQRQKFTSKGPLGQLFIFFTVSAINWHPVLCKFRLVTEVVNIYYSSQVSLGFILVHQCKFIDEDIATREETSEPLCTESTCIFLKFSVMFLFECANMLMHLAVCRSVCMHCCCCHFLCTSVCKQALKRDLIILPRPYNISQVSVRMHNSAYAEFKEIWSFGVG